MQDLEKIYVDPHTAEEVVAIQGLSLEIGRNEFAAPSSGAAPMAGWEAPSG